jgi:ribosomal protein L12E/L44/L45/RPP1/RPP2
LECSFDAKIFEGCRIFILGYNNHIINNYKIKMNELNSKIVEYVLVILIGLIISYVVFVQSQDSKVKFDQLNQKVDEIKMDIDGLRLDIIAKDLKIKQLDEQLNPKTETTTEGTDAETGKEKPVDSTKPTQSKTAPVIE